MYFLFFFFFSFQKLALQFHGHMEEANSQEYSSIIKTVYSNNLRNHQQYLLHNQNNFFKVILTISQIQPEDVYLSSNNLFPWISCSKQFPYKGKYDEEWAADRSVYN